MKMNSKNVLALLAGSALVFSAHAFSAEGKKAKKGKKPAAPAGEAAPAADAAAPAPAGDAAPASGSGDTAVADKAAPAKHRAPYGMAGCGLGSIVIKSNGKGAQIGAGFLNVTGVQTFGISTGSSNCKISKDDFAQREQEVFMEANLASVEQDSARGQGEHLAAFGDMLGCGQETDVSQLGEVAKSHHAEIFNSQDSKQVLSQFKALIKSDERLAKSCVRA
jgi:hypothetical protein